MKIGQVKALKDIAFRRLTDVKLTTFDKMIDVLTKEEKRGNARGASQIIYH